MYLLEIKKDECRIPLSSNLAKSIERPLKSANTVGVGKSKVRRWFHVDFFN